MSESQDGRKKNSIDQIPNLSEVVDNKQKQDQEKIDADTTSITQSVMSESSIKPIHSKKSITELISSAMNRKTVMETIKEEQGEDAVPHPVLYTVKDDNGARISEKKSIHKLAFKNRNPSI